MIAVCSYAMPSGHRKRAEWVEIRRASLFYPRGRGHVSCDSYMNCGRALTKSPSTDALSFRLVTLPCEEFSGLGKIAENSDKRHPQSRPRQRICVLGVLLHLSSWRRHESKKRPLSHASHQEAPAHRPRPAKDKTCWCLVPRAGISITPRFRNKSQ